MALHGFLAVTLTGGGNELITRWEARRTHKLTDIKKPSTYWCKVARIDGDRRSVEFEVQHLYADGAEALAGKVLARGAALLAEMS